jgi:hypothetical protein
MAGANDSGIDLNTSEVPEEDSDSDLESESERENWHTRCKAYAQAKINCMDDADKIPPQDFLENMKDLFEEKKELIRSRPLGITLVQAAEVIESYIMSVGH